MYVQLVSKIFNLCDPGPPILLTDRRTDRRADDKQSQYRALHCRASCGEKNYGKATDVIFGRYIYRVHPSKSPLKNFEKRTVGVSMDSPIFGGTPYYLRKG